MQDWLLGTFESSGTPLNRLLIADCLSFGQGWVGSGAWSHVVVSRLLFYTTGIITAGPQIRDSHFHEEGSMASSRRKRGCIDPPLSYFFLLSRRVNSEQSGGLCLSFLFCCLRLGERSWVQTICPALLVSFLALGLWEKCVCRWVCLPFSSLSREPHHTSSPWVSWTL